VASKTGQKEIQKAGGVSFTYNNITTFFITERGTGLHVVLSNDRVLLRRECHAEASKADIRYRAR
jgi:hypothetical protein